MTPEKITKLANNIAANQGAYVEEEAVKRVADHINMFWSSRMKTILHETIEQQDNQLHPHYQQATKLIHKAEA